MDYSNNNQFKNQRRNSRWNCHYSREGNQHDQFANDIVSDNHSRRKSVRKNPAVDHSDPEGRRYFYCQDHTLTGFFCAGAGFDRHDAVNIHSEHWNDAYREHLAGGCVLLLAMVLREFCVLCHHRDCGCDLPQPERYLRLRWQIPQVHGRGNRKLQRFGLCGDDRSRNAHTAPRA